MLTLQMLSPALASLASAQTIIKPGHTKIKEWHFHPYFNQNEPESLAAAEQLRDKVIAAVRNGEFVAVCDGMTADDIPGGVDDSEINPWTTAASGPHPTGEFEVWTPVEYFAEVYTFMTVERGDLSVLLHPLGRNMIEDHYPDAMWLGPSFPLSECWGPNRCLDPAGGDPPQFEGLGLGYSGPTDIYKYQTMKKRGEY